MRQVTMRRVRASAAHGLILAALAAQPLAAQVDARQSVFERSLVPSDDSRATATLAERMDYYGVPGVSIAVIRNGRIAWASGYGVLQAGGSEPVDTETVFSVGSVSKVGTASAVLRLVDDGRVELDRPVNDYLTRWRVPENRLTRQEPVTLRRIMSHTAGLTVHGFQDFQPGEPLPNVVQILEGTLPAKNPPVVVDLVPGRRFRYSGGGTTVQQLLLEEVTGMAFPDAVRRLVFEPLGMSRSTYVNPVPASHGNIAKAHDRAGRPRALPRGYEAMPEAAASGLWTTPTDFARLMIAFMEAYDGELDALWSRGLMQDVMTPVAPSDYGLGPEIRQLATDVRFMHGGSNDSYKALFGGFLRARDGAVVFTNGARGAELNTEIIRALERVEGWPNG